MEYKSGFRYACGWNKITFDVLGLWPKTKVTIFGKYRALVHAVIILIVITIPRLLGFFLLHGEIDALIQCLGTYLPFLIGVVKLITLHYRREVLARFLEEMELDWQLPLSKKEFSEMTYMASIGRRISIFSGSIAYAANSVGIIVQKWYNLEVMAIHNPDPRLTTNLFWVVYLPYNATGAVAHTISLIFQLYGSVYAALFYFIFDSFVVMLVLHLCGQLGKIQMDLRRIHRSTNIRGCQKFEAMLTTIVQRHERLIELSEDLEESFHVVHFLQLSGCTLMICFQGYGLLRLVTEGTINFFQVMFSVTVVFAIVVHFFFSCWAGEFLSSQSILVGQAAYECDWYQLPPHQARLLILISVKRFRPLQLTAGKFSVLTFSLFLEVLKTSMSYLSMLLAVKSRDH